MFLHTVLLTWLETVIRALLGALGARPAAALLATPHVELWSSTTDSTPQATYAAFTKCIFTGYASAVVTPSAAVQMSQSRWGLLANAVFIATTGSPYVADTAAGYLVTDGAGGLYAFERFASPVPFAAAGAFLDLDVFLPLNSPA